MKTKYKRLRRKELADLRLNWSAISWYVITKPYFVNKKGIKVDKEKYCRYLHKEMFPAIAKVVQRDNWIICSRWSTILSVLLSSKFS